ncbi:MAG: hypothetical protein MRY21_01705 [Simkaniaceae bacterium]|nr:hypothetical protein [Simkaniaceae bacterium]
MEIAIGNKGVKSVNFTIELDNTELSVEMAETLEEAENKKAFYMMQSRIQSLFRTNVSFQSTLSISYGVFTEETPLKFHATLLTLKNQGLVDDDRFTSLTESLCKIIDVVQAELTEEVEKHKELIHDFSETIESNYNVTLLHLLSGAGNEVDESLFRMEELLRRVKEFRGNPEKIGSEWVYLFIAEGALRSLIENINARDYARAQDRLVKLQEGIEAFLGKYESHLHPIAERSIDGLAGWLQELYRGYQRMVTTGIDPKGKAYYPKLGLVLAEYKLFMPRRFAAVKK